MNPHRYLASGTFRPTPVRLTAPLLCVSVPDAARCRGEATKRARTAAVIGAKTAELVASNRAAANVEVMF